MKKQPKKAAKGEKTVTKGTAHLVNEAMRAERMAQQHRSPCGGGFRVIRKENYE